jgi:hypothetical protein
MTRPNSWALVAHSLSPWEAEIWRITVPGQPGQILLKTLISKIIRAKWIKGVTQEVEHLVCKHGLDFKSQSHQTNKQTNKQTKGLEQPWLEYLKNV